jgi:hypothetical protein
VARHRPRAAARRLTVIAATYGTVAAREILHTVPRRIQTMLDGVPVAAAAGDEGMASLMAAGEPGRSQGSTDQPGRTHPGHRRAAGPELRVRNEMPTRP